MSSKFFVDEVCIIKDVRDGCFAFYLHFWELEKKHIFAKENLE